ncbi:MAG: hypothetical protein Q8M96_12500, partial [Rubrivivax sp.]|nr:hypothetical protein [Rubrivivax sp.]
MKPDDENWFETLAGRPPAGTDPATLREATLLRQALRRVVPDVAVTPAQDSVQTQLARALAAVCAGPYSPEAAVLAAEALVE